MNAFRIVWVAAMMALAFPIVSEGGKTSVADYRWRNDNGGESGATWKADPHTPITGVKRDENIRLRFTILCSEPVEGVELDVSYATSTNGPWIKAVTEVGGAFRITDTTWYANGDSTTAQMPVPPGKTFVSGECMESPSNTFRVTLPDTGKYTEAEVCLQATAYAVRNMTYYFFASGTMLHYPHLTIEDTDPANPPKDFYVDDSDAWGAKLIGSGFGGTVLLSGWTNGAWRGGSRYITVSTSETVSVSFRWTPDLPATAEYNAYARWTYAPTRGQRVPYTITYAGGTTEVLVNQRNPALGGQWNLLGTYTFNAGTNGWVEMGGNDGQACADAIWFEKIGGAPLDADGDGMLDSWENTYLGGTSASPTADADLDGMNNLQESLAGTIPNDPSSVLAITALTGSGSTLDLKWLSVAGKTYGIQKSTNLTQGFPLTEASGIGATPPTNNHSVTVGASGSGFYRVRLE